ncbi:hypothetical protein [Arthrobacter sp. UYCo732]|uniref:hypothetical protein n=1 Tax=Arthrobacter sp. UYCo732 TaxID=3156336 RepID=UPI003396EEA0
MSPDLHASHRGTFKLAEVSGNPGIFDEDENESIDSVIRYYGGFLAFELSGIVRNEDPWKSAWSGTEPGQQGRLIEVDRMQSYYVELDGEPVEAADPAESV